MPATCAAACRVSVVIRVHRERRHACDKFIRKVKGSRFQLRVYVGPGKADSWNFGLFETHEAARSARKKLTALWRPGMGPLEALAAAKRARVVPAGVLPRWVVRVKGGYGAKLRAAGVTLGGPYLTPESAYRAAAARVQATAA